MRKLNFDDVSIGAGLLALSALPGRHGDYTDDLACVQNWRPDLVISLTTLDEMRALGAENFGADIQASGGHWFHMPVTDFGTPKGNSQQEKHILNTAHTALQKGQRVFVHCKGGCGRSGMIALRLMLMAGETPEQALPRLRASRPCAVETRAQEQWAITLQETK